MINQSTNNNSLKTLTLSEQINNKVTVLTDKVKNSILGKIASKVCDVALTTINVITETTDLIVNTIKGLNFPTPKIITEFIDSVSNKVVDLKKIEVLSIISVPFSLIDITQSFWNFIKEAFHFCVSGCKRQIVNVSLLAMASLGELLKLPGDVARTVRFMPVPSGLWTSILSSIASVFSVASIAYTGRCHSATNKFIKEAESVKNRAFLTELKKSLEADPSTANKNLIGRITTTLNNEKIPELPKEIKNFMLLSEKLHSPLLNRAKREGKFAYLNHLKKYDEATLSKQFRLEGKKIKSALESINQSCTDTKIDKTFEILRGRIQSKLNSDKISILMDSVTLVAGILFLVLDFGVACSPLAPIAYAITVAVGAGTIGKIIYDFAMKHQANKQWKVIHN